MGNKRGINLIRYISRYILSFCEYIKADYLPEYFLISLFILQVKWKILLQQEIDLMSMLDHPNLIRFYGVVEEAAQLNIFVEWMPGGSVAKLLDKHGAFTENVILKYTQQILQGLSYLHSMGIIHRDLKGQ